jgi:hypothetical protein
MTEIKENVVVPGAVEVLDKQRLIAVAESAGRAGVRSRHSRIRVTESRNK